MFTLIAEFTDADGRACIAYNKFGALTTFDAEVAELRAIVREHDGRLETLTLEHRGVSMPLDLKF